LIDLAAELKISFAGWRDSTTVKKDLCAVFVERSMCIKERSNFSAEIFSLSIDRSSCSIESFLCSMERLNCGVE
jgi:hypothetical protein